MIDLSKITKYTIDDLKVKTSHGEIIIEKRKIKNITIVKNFDDNFLPILDIDVGLKYDEYYKILDSVEQVLIDVKISSYSLDVNQEKQDANIFLTPIIEGTFKLTIDDLDPYNSRAMHEEMKTTEGEDDSRMEDKELNLLLYNKAHLNKYRMLTNFVISNGTVADALGVILTRYNEPVLFMNPDNQKPIKELISPANNLIGAIKFIQEYYGIYDKGIQLFQDFNLLYLMDKYPCKVYRPKEIKKVKFYIPESDTKNAGSKGVFIDKDKQIIICNIPAGAYDIRNTNIITREIMGNGMIIVNSKNNTMNRVTADNMKSDKNDAFKVLNNYGGNNQVVNTSLHELNETGIVMDISFPEMNYGILTPNKAYVVEYEDPHLNKRYGGEFRLSKTSYVFTRSADEDFDVSTSVEVRKIK